MNKQKLAIRGGLIKVCLLAFFANILFSINSTAQVIYEGFEEGQWGAMGNSTSGSVSISQTSASSTMTLYNNTQSSSSTFTTAGPYTITVPFASSSVATNSSSTRTSYTVFYTQSVINTSPNSGLWLYSRGSLCTDNKLQRVRSAAQSFRIGGGGYLITPVISTGVASVTFWLQPGAGVNVGINSNTGNTTELPSYNTHTSSGNASSLGGFTQVSQFYPESGTAGNTSAMQSFSFSGTFSGPARVGFFSTDGTIHVDDIVITTFAAGTLPGLVLNTATATGQTSGTSTASISTNTPAPFSTIFRSGIIWSTTNAPLPDTSLTTKTTNGPAGVGVFSGNINANITGLMAGTTYYVRAYAATSGGLIYSNVLQFTTNPPVIATLTTTAASAITALSASSGGTIVNDGGAAITAKGVCWATTNNPTIANSFTINGSGNASFTSLLALLAPNTTYFARAYATNSAGTAYGNEITFTTPAATPTLVAVSNTFNFGNVTVNTNSAHQNFQVTGIALSPAAGNIVVNAPTNFAVSLSPNGPFTSSVNIPYTGGTLATTTVYVQFTPTLFGLLTGNITISGGTAPNATIAVSGIGIQSPNDFSNKGTEFWVGYACHEDMYASATTISSNGGGQRLNLYFTSDQAATVNVTIPGLGYTSPAINVAANSVTIFQIPNTISGQYAQLYQEGKFNKGIKITSNIPIVAYAHIYANYVSAATMLLPTNTWGTDYNTFNYNQNSSQNSTSFNYFFVVAKENNTVVEITPTNNSLGGLTAGVPFTVTLNEGEVYNALAGQGSDFTGTRVKTLDCNKKIAVFSGSGRTDIAPCSGTSSDNLFQQAMPKAAWGTKYLTTRTFGTVASNIYRIGVSDATTVVRVNGQTLPSANYPATLQNGFFYQIEDSIPLVITADKPVTVAQYIKSSNGCSNPNPNANFGRFNGDPEMIFISPVEQAIDKAILYSSAQQEISFHYINVIIPTTGVSSFTLDGVSMASKFVPHTEPGFSYAFLDSLSGNRLQAGQHIIQAAQPFNAIAYGYGDNNSRNSDPPRESYGYNAGTQIRDLTQVLFIQNPYAISTETKTCKDVPFKFRVTLPYAAGAVNSLQWNFFNTPNLAPSSASVIQNNPTPDSTFVVGGKTFYLYSIPTQYIFSTTGTFPVKVTANVTDLSGCSGSRDYTFDVVVVDGVITNFTTQNNYRICFKDSARFQDASNGQGFPLIKWQWNFGNSTIDSVRNPVRFYAAPGTYQVTLRAINSLGCYADVQRPVNVLVLPTAAFTSTSPVCVNTPMVFNSSTSTGGGGSINGWQWSFGNSTTSAQANPTATYTIANSYTVKLNVTTADGCKDSITNTVNVLPLLAQITITSSNITANGMQFNWTAVPNATAYEVSINGSPYITPSSGAAGLSHVVTGLSPDQNVCIDVKAKATLNCQWSITNFCDKTLLPDVGIYVPNTFTPNGDGKNDRLAVYGNYIKTARLQIFNQWGEKVFEGNEATVVCNTNICNNGWDGSYKGKQQPVGVYIFVLQVETTKGEIVNQKGSINIIR